MRKWRIPALGAEAVARIVKTIAVYDDFCAAFKGGVKLSQIARHFGVSQSDVRKALAGEGMTR